MSAKFLWNKVFVLGAQMTQTPDGKYEFLEWDKNGYIGGALRIVAAKILLERRLTGEMFVVAGPTPDGKSKAKMMAEMIGPKVTPLESTPSTGGNFGIVGSYYTSFGKSEDRDGILTHLYHLPRAWLFAQEAGLMNLSPIPAEGVVAVIGDKHAQKELRDTLHTYCGDAYATRIWNEAKGVVELQMKGDGISR